MTSLNTDLFSNKKVALAVSGGVDSIVLLDVFNKLAKEKKIELYVFHFNHKWRKESSLDAHLVKNYCKNHEIDFIYEEAKGEIKKNEDEARKQRYSFLLKEAKRRSIDFILTAHHADDQFETVLFRLCRGTGLAGMLPIKEVLENEEGITIVRPFLNITKKDLCHYAKFNKLSYLQDKSNDDLNYKRNLIRKKIIPLLEKINPSSKENILKFSYLAFSCFTILDKFFFNFLKKISVREKSEFILIKLIRRAVLKLPAQERKAFFYWLLTKNDLAGGLAKLDSIVDLTDSTGKMDLSSSVRLSIDKKYITFVNSRMKSNKEVLKKTVELIPFKGSTFKRNFPKDNKKTAYVNMSNYSSKQLLVRHRKPGDIFFPLGFSAPTKLKSYLINKKIPKEERDKIPLLCLDNEVLWLPGYAVSDKIKVLNKPTHILKLKDKI